jgi:hypothetical protein
MERNAPFSDTSQMVAAQIGRPVETSFHVGFDSMQDLHC